MPDMQKQSKMVSAGQSRAFSCGVCGHHVHPTAGTLFQDSRTSLQSWFIAIHMFTTSRHGVSAMELMRQLGVTYKCAWRMGHQIRQHMAQIDDEMPLYGEVEIDETYVGGRTTGGTRGRGAPNKTIVFGMMQRNGQVMTKVVPNVAKKTLQPIIEENILDGSTIHTDELKSYKGLKKAGYDHQTVNHAAGEYAQGENHVNNLENFGST